MRDRSGAGGVGMARLGVTLIVLACIAAGMLFGWLLVRGANHSEVQEQRACNVDCKPYAGEMRVGWCYCDKGLKVPDEHRKNAYE